ALTYESWRVRQRADQPPENAEAWRKSEGFQSKQEGGTCRVNGARRHSQKTTPVWTSCIVPVRPSGNLQPPFLFREVLSGASGICQRSASDNIGLVQGGISECDASLARCHPPLPLSSQVVSRSRKGDPAPPWVEPGLRSRLSPLTGPVR